MAYRKNYKKPVRRFRKRWYVNASANVPFLGRTNIRMGNQIAKRSLAAAVTAIQKRNSEPKHKLTNQTYVMATHNTLISKNLCGNIARGDSFNTRDGDTIHLEAFKAKFFFQKNPVENATLYYRILILKSRLAVGAGTDNWNNALTSGDIFKNLGGGPLTWMVDSKLVTVLYDETTRLPDTQFSGQLIGAHKDIFVPLKYKFEYQNQTDYNKHMNLYMVFIPFLVGGTPGTTITMDFTTTTDLIFKDL